MTSFRVHGSAGGKVAVVMIDHRWHVFRLSEAEAAELARMIQAELERRRRP
jgi:hypothetical protein